MPFDPKKNPYGDYYQPDPTLAYFAEDRGHSDLSMQASRMDIITPGNVDLVVYAKAISTVISNGGRGILTYLPMKNPDETTVTHEVYDGWVSLCAIRRVISFTPIAGSTAVILRMDD